MDKRLLDLFVSEVQSQCEFIVYGAGELNAVLSEPSPTRQQWMDQQWQAERKRTQPRAWFAIQGIVISAGNLSKLFWGRDKKKSEAERAPLRSALDVVDDSFLRDPSLRNRFEHFDEDLVQWHKRQVKRDQGYVFMGRNIGNIMAINEQERFAHYDPATGLITTLGRSLSLPDLLAEANRLLTACHAHNGF